MKKSEKALELLKNKEESIELTRKLVFVLELMETAPDWFGKGREFIADMKAERKGYIKLKPTKGDKEDVCWIKIEDLPPFTLDYLMSKCREGNRSMRVQSLRDAFNLEKMKRNRKPKE
jgi:hypothetical protein